MTTWPVIKLSVPLRVYMYVCVCVRVCVCSEFQLGEARFAVRVISGVKRSSCAPPFRLAAALSSTSGVTGSIIIY